MLGQSLEANLSSKDDETMDDSQESSRAQLDRNAREDLPRTGNGEQSHELEQVKWNQVRERLHFRFPRGSRAGSPRRPQ